MAIIDIFSLKMNMHSQVKLKKNAGYGYVKGRIIAQNGIFGAEMAQKISKMTNFGPIKGRSAQNMGPINFGQIQKLFLLTRQNFLWTKKKF